MRRAVHLSVALSALLLTPFFGCRGQQDAEPGGAETPEAAFAAFQEAAQEKDWKAVAELLTPESQESMAAGMIFIASFMAAFDEGKGKELEQLLKKHGLDPDAAKGPDAEEAASLEQALKAAVGPIKDKPALIAEMIGWLDENAEGAGGSSFAEGFGSIASAKLSDLSIEGDTATGTVTGEDESGPIEFRRLNGRWLIHIPEDETRMGPGSDETSDWGPSGGFDEFSFGFDEGDPLPPVEAVSVDDFNAAWQTSLDVSSKPAIEVLRQLAGECALEVQEGGDVAGPLSQPVTIKLEAVSRLGAIEEVAKKVGLYPRYTLRKLGFRPGPRPLPVAFAGPFLVEVAGLKEVVPYATGSVELRFLAGAIPTAAIAQLKGLNFSLDVEDDRTLTLRRVEVTGTGGQDVLDAEQGGLMPQATRTFIILARTIGLKNLIRSVVEVERLSGELSFALPTKMTTLTFADVAKGATASVEGVSLKIGRVGLGEQSSVAIEYEGTDSNHMTVVPLGADGEALKVLLYSGSWSDGKGSLDVFVEGKPASIEVRVIQETQRVRLPFELGGIPLESHEQMPEEIQPLKFDGDEPVAVEFAGFRGSGDARQIVLRVTNHANKDLASLDLRLNYYDASDKKLDDSPHVHSGGPSFVAAGGTEEIEVSTFFMPDETKSIRVDVTSADFADATKWEADR